MASEPQSFEIAARIDHRSDGVGCFDPIQVVCRLRVAFPDVIEHTRDHLWETCDWMRRQSGEGAEGALRIAVRDMMERARRFHSSSRGRTAGPTVASPSGTG